MPVDFGIVYPLWSHAEGGDSLLERVAGEVGIDHVTIPVVTGPRTVFRFFGPNETPYFRTEGGFHFPPRAKLYTSSGLRPRSARWIGQRDDLRRLCDTARGLGVRVILRIDASALESLGSRAVDLAPRNAWGDAYEAAPPCASSPHLRAFLSAVVADCLRFEPDGFELVNLSLDAIFPELVMSLLESPFGPGLELCFCAACRHVAAADVDPEQAARSVRAHNSRFASLFKLGMTTADLARRFLHDQVLIDYVFSRVRSAETWLSGLAQRHPDKAFLLGPIGPTPSSIAFGEIKGVRRIASFAEDEDDAEDEPSDALAAPEGETAQRPTPAPSDAIAMPLWWCWRRGADALVRAVSDATDSGFTYFDFSDLDQTPLPTIDWLRQALRYARRT